MNVDIFDHFFKQMVTNFCFWQLDIYSLSRKWKELVDKARAKQLQPHEYNSGISLPHYTNLNM
jgi:hypothetical protein